METAVSRGLAKARLMVQMQVQRQVQSQVCRCWGMEGGACVGAERWAAQEEQKHRGKLRLQEQRGCPPA